MCVCVKNDFVKVVFTVCMVVGAWMLEKALSVFVVYCVQFAVLWLENVYLVCCSLYLMRVLIFGR